MTSNYTKLEEVYAKTFHELAPLILLHPGEKRDYTEEEFDHLKQRDFKTRWFMRNTTVNGTSVSLRTHFTDNHKYESHLNYVRDYFKAATVTNNLTSAKTTLTELLSMFFAFKPSQYYSFAVSTASGLSNYGDNISFELGTNGLLEEGYSELAARKKLCLFMDIIFSKVAMYRFLVQSEGTNTYRLVHCGTKGSRIKSPLVYAFFSFLLQLCLTGYVVLENITSAESLSLRNLPLAILTLVYSTMIAYPGMTDSGIARKLYGKIGLLQTVDYFVNTILTVVLLISGFFVIMIQESFIEAVLNTAALLFIPEIDDQLPKLLGLDEEAIIRNYLTYQSLKEFDAISKMDDVTITKKLTEMQNQSIGVPFCDYYLTNIEEQATYPEDGITFSPYQVKAGKNGDGHQIGSSSFVTGSCLIRKLVWSYTTSDKYVHSSTPRIGYLKIEKLFSSHENIEIHRKGPVDDDCYVSDVKHVLEGVFIITTFQMSDDIIRLRVCGSPSAKDFMAAFEYYSLWELGTNATNILQAEIAKEKSHKLGKMQPMKSFDQYISMGRVPSSSSNSDMGGMGSFA